LAIHVSESLFNFIYESKALADSLLDLGIGCIIIIVVAFLMELGAGVVKRSIGKLVNWYYPLAAQEGGGTRREADQ
jgi:hypothetical protein